MMFTEIKMRLPCKKGLYGSRERALFAMILHFSRALGAGAGLRF